MKPIDRLTDHEIETLVAQLPGDELAVLGNELRSLGALVAAERVLDGAVNRGSDDGLVHRAVLAMDMERFDEAVALAQRAIERGLPEALIVLGNALSEKGDTAAAINAYEAATSQGLAEGALNTANTLSGAGRTSEAEQLYLRCIEDGDPIARRNYGVFLMGQDRNSEAIEALIAASATDPKAWFDLGNCQAKVGMYTQAAQAYRDGAVVGDVRCHLALADLLADDLDDPVGAETQYRAAIARADELAYFNFAMFLLDESRTSEAKIYLVLAACSGQSDAREYLSEITDSP